MVLILIPWAQVQPFLWHTWAFQAHLCFTLLTLSSSRANAFIRTFCVLLQFEFNWATFLSSFSELIRAPKQDFSLYYKESSMGRDPLIPVSDAPAMRWWCILVGVYFKPSVWKHRNEGEREAKLLFHSCRQKKNFFSWRKVVSLSFHQQSRN